MGSKPNYSSIFCGEIIQKFDPFADLYEIVGNSLFICVISEIFAHVIWRVGTDKVEFKIGVTQSQQCLNVITNMNLVEHSY